MTMEFLITSLVVIVLPGSGVLYTLAFGLGRGTRASVLAAAGCTLGIVPHIVASTIGLAALLHASAMAFEVIRLLGVAYLFYMAWEVLRSGGALEIDDAGPAQSGGRIVLNGFLLNILNPKLSIFFLAFLPLFVPADATAPAATMLVLGMIFMLLTFAVFVAYGGFAAAARRHVISRPGVLRWLRRGFAGAFGLIGMRLLLADR